MPYGVSRPVPTTYNACRLSLRPLWANSQLRLVAVSRWAANGLDAYEPCDAGVLRMFATPQLSGAAPAMTLRPEFHTGQPGSPAGTVNDVFARLLRSPKLTYEF